MKRFSVVLLGALLLTSAWVTAQSPPKVVRSPQVVPPDEMKWGTYKQATPAGAKVAILYGNPENVGGGPFVIRVRAADGASVGPQWHSVDLHITVLQGHLLFGEGNPFDESKAQQLNPGSYIQVPRGLPYTIMAKGETEYQVQGNAVLRTYAVPAPAPVAAPSPAAPTEEQRQKTEFDAAVAAFTRASRANDQTALQGPVRREFERIARGGGRYAGSAQEYLSTRFAPGVAMVQAGGCPVIPALKDRGWIVQEPKAGDVVATGLLDNRLVWTNCPTPRFPDLARTTASRPTTLKLAVTLDERGSVVTVKLRGGIAPPGFYEAAEAAVRQWKTNPPRAKGVAVRTEVSVDIPFTP
jgi:TonB family protein